MGQCYCYLFETSSFLFWNKETMVPYPFAQTYVLYRTAHVTIDGVVSRTGTCSTYLFALEASVVDPWLLVRIRGSVPMTSESGSGFFRQWLTRCFLVLLFEGTFTSVFTDKKSKRSQKIVEIRVFLTLFAFWWKGPGRPKNIGILRIRI